MGKAPEVSRGSSCRMERKVSLPSKPRPDKNAPMTGITDSSSPSHCTRPSRNCSRKLLRPQKCHTTPLHHQTRPSTTIIDTAIPEPWSSFRPSLHKAFMAMQCKWSDENILSCVKWVAASKIVYLWSGPGNNRPRDTPHRLAYAKRPGSLSCLPSTPSDPERGWELWSGSASPGSIRKRFSLLWDIDILLCWQTLKMLSNTLHNFNRWRQKVISN